MAKYLDSLGLQHFWGKIKLWVKSYVNVSVDGNGNKTITFDNDGTSVVIEPLERANGLTDVSYDTTNKKITKTKNGTTTDIVTVATLRTDMNVADGAEVNQNAFSTIKVTPASGSSTNIAADTKTDILELKAGDNITLTPDATNDKVTIALSGSPALTGTPTAPTASSGTNTTQIATTEFVQNAVVAGTGAVEIDGIRGSTINRYGTCNTSGDTAAKTVTIKYGTFPASLTVNSEGLRITVKFTSANTAQHPTLNVNDSGAIPIYPSVGSVLDFRSINGICDFIYYESKGSGGWYLASDGRVSCEDNHYWPTADSNYQLRADIDGTAGSYTIDTEYTLLTGVQAQCDSKGHVTGLTYTAQKIKNTNTDTKVNVTKDQTTKAYLLGVSTTPTTTAQALETLSDTAVYLDTTAGKLTATNFAGKINDVTVSKATTGFTIAGGTTSKTLTVNDTYTLGAACAKAVDSSISANSSSTNLPTSAAVESRIAEAITSAQVGAAMFQGVIKSGTSLTALPTTGYKKGWYWIVGTAGTYAGVVCEAGDTIFCVNDYASAFSNNDFNVVQTNIETITNAEIDTIIVGS